MKLNISGPLKVTLALIVSASLSIFGTAVNANAEPVPDPAELEFQEVLQTVIQEYQQRTGVSAELAKAVLDDQGKLVIELIPALGIEDGINADIWLEPVEGGQAINVRTQDEQIIADLMKQEFAASKVIIYREPVIAETVPDIDSVEVREAIVSVVPDLQGLAVRVEDGALELHLLKELSATDIELLKERTGFSKVELVISDDPYQDEMRIDGGAAITDCTAGFAAKSGSNYGFVTAGHCADGVLTSKIYSNPNSRTGSYVTATRGTWVNNADKDVAFYKVPTSGNTFSGHVYVGRNNSTLSRVRGKAIPVKGTSVCHRGMGLIVTGGGVGWACGSIFEPKIAVPGKSCSKKLCNAKFVSVTAAHEKQDSGGPWVILSSKDGQYYAIGIHKAGAGALSYYNPIDNFPSGISMIYN